MPPLSDFIVSRDGNAWQKLGQDEYKSQNYTEALDAFTKALQLGQGDYVGVLDNRAATYCAMGRLDTALGDGRRMIKTDKKDPRGYLRTAKVLQLMKRLDEALRLYDYGLNTLDPKSQGGQQLRTLRTKLERAINGPKLLDPFTIFPPELISEVLCYLDLKTLLRVVRVSKLWQRLSVSFAKAWSHLDLSIARRTVSPTAIRAYLKRSHQVLTRATLTNIKPGDLEKIVTFLSRCQSLRRCDIDVELPNGASFIPLNRLTQLTTLIVGRSWSIMSSQLLDVLSRCSSLERIEAHVDFVPLDRPELPKLPNLRSLTVIDSGRRTSNSFGFLYDDYVAAKLPNLEALSVTGCVHSHFNQPFNISGFTHLRRCQIRQWDLSFLPELPRTLEELSLIEIDIRDDGTEELFMGMMNLKAVYFEFFSGLSSENLQCLLEDAKPSLTKLSIAYNLISGEDIKDFLSAGLLQQITHFNICEVEGVDDDFLRLLVDNMPNLEVLDVTGTEITPLGMKQLVDADGTKLRTLIAPSLLRNLDYRDLAAYVRKKGIHIPPAPAMNRPPQYNFFEL